MEGYQDTDLAEAIDEGFAEPMRRTVYEGGSKVLNSTGNVSYRPRKSKTKAQYQYFTQKPTQNIMAGLGGDRLTTLTSELDDGVEEDLPQEAFKYQSFPVTAVEAKTIAH